MDRICSAVKFTYDNHQQHNEKNLILLPSFKQLFVEKAKLLIEYLICGIAGAERMVGVVLCEKGEKRKRETSKNGSLASALKLFSE